MLKHILFTKLQILPVFYGNFWILDLNFFLWY